MHAILMDKVTLVPLIIAAPTFSCVVKYGDCVRELMYVSTISFYAFILDSLMSHSWGLTALKPTYMKCIAVPQG